MICRLRDLYASITIVDKNIQEILDIQVLGLDIEAFISQALRDVK
jgi:hypothetical protein